MTRETLLLLCGVASLNLSATTLADAIYKTVDAQGHVSYTSRNPALDNPANPKAQEIKADSGYNNTLPVTHIGSTNYCGETQLPMRTLDGQHFYENVANAKRNW